MTTSTRRPPIFGPEPWADRAGESWSHWDLWFCLVCITETDGDWDAQEEAVIARDRQRSVTSRVWERKRSHLLDLRNRLDAAGLTAADLAAEVYGAAIAGGGWHVDHRTRLCRQRAGHDPAPHPRLRVVE